MTRALNYRFLIPALTVMSLVALCRHGGATTFHVSPMGSNTLPYDTYSKAAHEIADAILTASGPGDTVLIHSGEYETDTTVFLPVGLTLAGVGRDSVYWSFVQTEQPPPPDHIVRPQGKNVILGIEFDYPRGSSFNPAMAAIGVFKPESLFVHDCRIRQMRSSIQGHGYLEVSNTEFYYDTQEGLSLGVSHAWIHHNTFFGKSGGDGIFLNYAGNIVIEDNIFDEDPVGRPTAIRVRYVTHVEIRNNLILNSAEPVSWRFGSGIIENNTMIVAGGTPLQFPQHRAILFFLRSKDTLVIRNNVMKDFNAVLEFGNECEICAPTGPIRFTHNAFWPPADSFHALWSFSNPDQVPILDSGNFNASPMFADDSLFPLQAGSPLIDTGDPTVLDPDGTRSDIGWTGGPGGTGYTYLDLAPLPPESLWIGGNGNTVHLAWSERPEADLSGYNIYRGDSPGFWPSSLPPVQTIDRGDTTTVDTLWESGSSAYYVVTAVDSSGQESGPSPEGSVVVTGVHDDPAATPIPRTPHIARAYPNPFNASTIIEIVIPDIGILPASVEVIVYDVLGRRVATVFRGSLNPGTHALRWNTSRTSGGSITSGVYFASLRVWDRAWGRPVKLVLLK